MRLASEAYRIRLAHLFDPYLALNASQIEALPHQITAIYGEMLPRQPLRFLLADDLGAGKDHHGRSFDQGTLDPWRSGEMPDLSVVRFFGTTGCLS